MDPLSVIAGITGILTAAVKISSAASSLISGWKEAPIVIHGILLEMSALRACLTQLKPYIQGIETATSSRTRAISVEQIVIVTSSCVLAISELQKTLDGLISEQALSRRTKIRWASHEKKLNILRSRVQASTSSLNLILTVITCSTLEESRQSIGKLDRKVDHMIRTDTDLIERISNSEPKGWQNHYVESMSQSALNIHEGASTLTTEDKESLSGEFSSKLQGQYVFGLDAEIEHGLYASLAYLRADGRHSLSSLPTTSGSASKQGWAFLSQLSLAQVSNLSVLSLPISSQELWNPRQYQTPIRSKSQENHTVKMLLLGPGEAGKSTLLKQMRLAYAQPFSLAERSDYRDIIRSNVLYAYKILQKAFHDYGFDFHNPQSREHKVTMIETQDDSGNNPAICPGCSFAMNTVWRSSGIQQRFTLDSEWALHNKFLNCLKDINRLASPEYLPTDDDILKGYVRTTGISKTLLAPPNPLGRQYRVLDVGGARSERKKWVHAFDAVDIVFFVAPLSGYDQCLKEDYDDIELREAITLFEAMLRSAWLTKSSFILVLNKLDLLAEKLETNSSYQHWPGYDGPLGDLKSVTDFIRKKFLDLAEAAGRVIDIYIVNLTDIDDTRKMLENTLNESSQHSEVDVRNKMPAEESMNTSVTEITSWAYLISPINPVKEPHGDRTFNSDQRPQRMHISSQSFPITKSLPESSLSPDEFDYYRPLPIRTYPEVPKSKLDTPST